MGLHRRRVHHQDGSAAGRLSECGQRRLRAERDGSLLILLSCAVSTVRSGVKKNSEICFVG